MIGHYITEERIKSLLEQSEIDVKTIFETTTIVSVKLPNGFTIVESSGCIDARNYSEEIGAEICIAKIEDKLWQLEGYALQDQISRLKNGGII